MIELLFRGKHGAKWIESNSIKHENDSVYLLYAGIWTEIIPETLGRYTGINDRKHTQIFEDDIVKHYNYKNDLTRFDTGKIFWDENCAGFLRTSKSDYGKTYFICMDISFPYEVIGNVYDNPELLKGGTE